MSCASPPPPQPVQPPAPVAFPAATSDGFAEWGDPRAYPLLLRHVEDRKNNEDARLSACRALPWLASQSQAAELAKRVKTLAASRSKQDQFVAQCLSHGISRRAFPGANAVIIELLAPGTDALIRRNAALALGRSGLTDAESSQLLAKGKDSTDTLRTDVAISLVLGGSVSAARAIVAGMSHNEVGGISTDLRFALDSVSEEDLREVLPRVARNAREVGMRGLLSHQRLDSGPRSLTGVVLRYRVRQIGGEDAAQVLQLMDDAAEP